jgi:hypothetical protein
MHKKSVLLAVACAVFLSNARSAAYDSTAAKTFSETVKRQRVAAIDDLTQKMHAADRLEIEDLMVADSAARFGVEKDGKMVWKDLPKPIRHITIDDKEELERLLRDLKPSEELLSPTIEARIENGEKVLVHPPRLSSPEFECRFFCRNKELLRLTLHQEGAFIEIGPDTTSFEFDLTQPEGGRLDGQIREAFKKHNQPPLPTPASVTPAASVPAAAPPDKTGQ